MDAANAATAPVVAATARCVHRPVIRVSTIIDPAIAATTVTASMVIQNVWAGVDASAGPFPLQWVGSSFGSRFCQSSQVISTTAAGIQSEIMVSALRKKMMQSFSVLMNSCLK